MKYIVPVLLLTLFISCSSKKKPAEATHTDTAITTRALPNNTTKPYAQTDTVIIASKHFDTLIYSKQAFNEIVDNFPSLYADIPLHPDLSYAQSGYSKEIMQKDGITKSLSFASEVGQDTYYGLYAYFLKQQNKGAKADSLRESLIAIYDHINDIFGYLDHGGTFFGHQFSRINAYAEYSVYEYDADEPANNSLSFAKLKNLYLVSLKEIVTSTIQADNGMPDSKSKKDLQEKVLKHVDSLSSLITNNFLLKKAQQFQYDYY